MKNIVTLPAILVFICATAAINSCSNWQNEIPVATIHRPGDNYSYFVGEKMDIMINAYDNDGTIAQVEILLNGTSIAILNSKPYTFSHEIKNIQPGDYNLEVVGTDDKGERVSSKQVIRVLPDLEVFTDSRDGNTYRYVTIGNQTWMADNLAFLPEVYPPSEGSDNLPHYYVYDYYGYDVSTANQTDEYSKFGVLYNWEAAKQASPEGWHLPTESEWGELLDYMKNELIWDPIVRHLMRHRDSGGGTNYYGFSAALAGHRSNGWRMGLPGSMVQYDPSFEGDKCRWWINSENNAMVYAYQYIYYSYHRKSNYLDYEDPDNGSSIRCIKD